MHPSRRLIFLKVCLWLSEIQLSMNDENTFFYNQQVSTEWIRWWWKLVKKIEKWSSLIYNNNDGSFQDKLEQLKLGKSRTVRFLLTHSSSRSIKYHLYIKFCILRKKDVFLFPPSRYICGLVLFKITMTNEMAVLQLVWPMRGLYYPDQIECCNSVRGWECTHSLHSLNMINNLFCNKGRRSIARMLIHNL